MPITHFRKKGFEICCYTVASVEQTNEMLLLIIWKCIWSRILEFLCCSLMVFLFWSLTLFGDNEWMQGKIHNFIFCKNIDNFFYICSFLLFLFLLLLFLPFDFETRFKVDPLTDASRFDCLIYSTNCWSFLLPQCHVCKFLSCC